MDSLSLLVYDLIFSIKLPEYPGMGHQVILPQRIYYCCFNNRVIMNNADKNEILLQKLLRGMWQCSVADASDDLSVPHLWSSCACPVLR